MFQIARDFSHSTRQGGPVAWICVGMSLLFRVG
jgi:hypothetical protein